MRGEQVVGVEGGRVEGRGAQVVGVLGRGYSLFWGLDPPPRTVKTQLTCGRWSHTLI